MEDANLSSDSDNVYDDKYYKKYKYMKRFIFSIIYENVAIRDEISELKKKVITLKEECTVLTNKMDIQKRGKKHNSVTKKGGSKKSSILKKTLEARDKSALSPKSISSLTPVRQGDSIMSTSASPSVQRKVKKMYKKRKPKENIRLQYDPYGQLVFPITLNDFEIHSLGEIVFDRPNYHTEDLIYPIGFCSTHVYGSVYNPQLKCIYTCKVSDGGYFPRFEISSDGEDGVSFVGSTPDVCHSQLVSMINKKYAIPILNEHVKRGADFFGLSHPTIHRLILSLPGVVHCSKYSQSNFDNRSKVIEKDAGLRNDIEKVINYEALLKTLTAAKLISQDNSWLYL